MSRYLVYAGCLLLTLLSLLLCGAMLAVPAAGLEEAQTAPLAPLGPVLLEGNVKRMDSGALLLTGRGGAGGGEGLRRVGGGAVGGCGMS